MTQQHPQPHLSLIEPDLTPSQARRDDQNVGDIERIASTAVGLYVLGMGLLRRGPIGLVMTAAGGLLTYHGVKKHSHTYSLLGVGSEDAGLTSNPLSRDLHSHAVISVKKAPHELREIWQDTPGLARFFPHVEHIEPLEGERRSRWHLLLPTGHAVSYTAVSEVDEENNAISWHTEPGGPISHRGTISFREGTLRDGSIVTLHQTYHYPAGVFGAIAGKLASTDPGREANEALRRFKQFAETGDVIANTGPAARGSGFTTGSVHEATLAAAGHARHHYAEDNRRDQNTNPNGRHPPEDKIDHGLEETFPASDPPAYSPAEEPPRGTARDD